MSQPHVLGVSPARAEPGAGGRRWSTIAYAVATGAALLAVVCLGAASIGAWSLIDIGLFFAAALIIVARARAGLRLVWLPLLWPVLAFGLLVAWQWRSGHSAYPAATFTGLVQLAGCGAMLYLAVVGFRSSTAIRRLGLVVWIFTGALGAEALAQFFTANKQIYWLRDASYATPIGPYIYHNHFAGCMDLLIPVAIAFALRTLRHSHDAPWLARLRRGILPALALAALVVSQSRGGFFALLLEAAVAAALFWPELRRHRRHRRGAAVAAGLLIGFSLLAGWGPLLQRLGNLAHHDVSTLDRLRVNQACLTIWRTHPWIGTGFGTFPVVYPRYQTFDSGQQFLEAHDDYAQALAETGLIGIVLVAVFFGLLLLAALRPAAGCSPRSEALRKAILVGLIGFLFHSFGDFQFHSPANALLFFLFAGAVVAGGVRRPKSLEPAV